MKFFLILILFFLAVTLESSYAQSLENELTITISSNGDARITQTLDTPTTVSSVNVQLLSDNISNLLTTDEKNIFLTNFQNGNQLRIDSLGASYITLSYDANIVTNDSGIWKINYDSNLESSLVFPPLSNILYVNALPLNIVDNQIVMPPGQISVSYTIREIVSQDFSIYSDGLSHTVKIMTASQIDSFEHVSEMISFRIVDNTPLLVIIPNSLSKGPFEISLNEKLLEHQNYLQDGSTWIRIEPPESGMMKISGKTPPTTLLSSEENGGCLIATATYGTELAPQVQHLRELRDTKLLQTESGTSFMKFFNEFYYYFSPHVADYERENPAFKEMVKIAITPILSTLSIMQHADSDLEVLGFGIGVILLNLGMYVATPALVGWQIKKRI